MLFNSWAFLIFLVSAFALYHAFFVRRPRWRNGFLFVISYIFYGWWDYRFLALIAVSTIVDYTVGLKLARAEDRTVRKGLLALSLAVNLGMLAYFKYANFFIESFIEFSDRILGFESNPVSLEIILPVGISFYTFQTLSYTIDVYRKRIQPTGDPIKFAAFVSFFPQLVAGPIERASHLLPQFDRRYTFKYEDGSDGIRLIVWGLFKKTVIADNCAPYVNEIFATFDSQPAAVLLMGAILFAFQIYGDFSGYSDMAIGTARLFGFRLMTNFSYPYFSRDVAEFWRRWHISLSTWFRDYLYIPLGGSRKRMSLTLRNVFVIFVVSGFWHGANWTFLAWGALHAAFIMPVVALGANRRNREFDPAILPSLKTLAEMAITFAAVCLAWIFFRAENLSTAYRYCLRLFTEYDLPSNFYFFPPFLLSLIFFTTIVEWLGRQHTPECWMGNIPKGLRYGFYTLLLFLWFTFAPSQEQAFIYFQF